jgi:cytochrome c-type biogenesis protein CcmE
VEAVEININYKYVLAIVLIVLSGVLAYDAFTSYIDPYLTVSQITTNKGIYEDKDVQVLGTVANGSITYEGLFLLFDLIDDTSLIKVNYTGSPPSNFQEGGQVVVIGKLVRPDTVESTDLLIKCPSKYEGEEQSLFTDPVFLVAVLLGAAVIVGTVVTTAWKRKKQST